VPKGGKTRGGQKLFSLTSPRGNLVCNNIIGGVQRELFQIPPAEEEVAISLNVAKYTSEWGQLLGGVFPQSNSPVLRDVGGETKNFFERIWSYCEGDMRPIFNGLEKGIQEKT